MRRTDHRRPAQLRLFFALALLTVGCDAILGIVEVPAGGEDGGLPPVDATAAEVGLDASSGGADGDGSPTAAEANSGDSLGDRPIQASDASEGGPDGDAGLPADSMLDAPADNVADAPADIAADAPADVVADTPPDTSSCGNVCPIHAAQCGPGGIQTCEMQATGCTDWVTTTCKGGFICEGATPAVACLDPSWAEWPMPNSPGDIVGGAPNPESYTSNLDGTVTDNVTSLMWEQPVVTTTFSWGSVGTSGTAQYYCAHLNLAGHIDWRLPSVIELSSIVNFSQSDPAINPTYFPGTPASYFWSSTPNAAYTTLALGVWFSSGGSNNFSVGNSYNVRCVR